MAIVASLVISILALILGSAGFALGAWAVVQVLAWNRSTHRITTVSPEIQETRIEADLPQHILDQLPSPPEAMSAEKYLQWQRRQQLEDDFNEL
jgi:alpha/beta superfamily hydrolase